MSIIKDYPCPNCGANLFKVGFNHILYDGYKTTEYSFKWNYLKKYTDTQYYGEYIECDSCNAQLDVDTEDFVKMIERMWNE